MFHTGKRDKYFYITFEFEFIVEAYLMQLKHSDRIVNYRKTYQQVDYQVIDLFFVFISFL